MPFVKGLRLHGGNARENREDLVMAGGRDGGVQEEFVHFRETLDQKEEKE